MKPRSFLLAFLALLAVPAFGAQAPVVVSSAGLATYIKASQESANIDAAFDGDEESNITGTRTGAAIEIDFSAYVTTDKPRVYISDIIVANVGGHYSLKISEDGTTWTDVPDAQNIEGNGTATYPVGLRVLKVKYVFESSSGAD